MSSHSHFASLLLSQPSAAHGEQSSEADPVRMHELRAMFQAFAPDVTESEIIDVAAIQSELDAQHARLQYLLDGRILSNVEYAGALNREVAWGMRRTAARIGEDKARRLFGVESLQDIVLVEPSAMSRVSNVADVRRAVQVFLSHYLPKPEERQQVITAIEAIRPSQGEHVIPEIWQATGSYHSLIVTLSAAENAYLSGAVQHSIHCAQQVLDAVSESPYVTDAPLYFVSWAQHIQGRAYEVLQDWPRASFSFECSLALKSHLEWLPELAVYASEIKLGSVETSYSPVEAATRLARISESLSGHAWWEKRRNRELHLSLEVDSLASLAEAYLAAGNHSRAIREARGATKLARRIHDSVAEIRAVVVLYLASALPMHAAQQQVQHLANDPRIAAHPRVRRVLTELRLELPQPPQKG